MNCLKNPIRIGQRGALVVMAMAATIASGLLESRGQPVDANASPGTNSASSAPPSAATVEMSPSQLNGIKIEPVGTFLFPVEKEEVGSVSFDEDPATVQAESTLIGAAATFKLTSKELARVQALGETNGVAQKELEQATSDEQSAGGTLKAARDAVRALGETDDDIDQMIAVGRIESAQAVHSPPKWVLANVTESDSPLFRAGQPVKVKVTALPNRVFQGTISKIYATVDPNTHREAIRSEVDDPKDELRVGMLATVVIEVQKPVEAIAIPANGVVREGDGTMTAWVTTDRQHFTQRILKTGMREDGEVQVLDGLQRGELVVSDGAIFLDNMLQLPPGD